MISVKCVYPDCTAPEKKFDWNEYPYGWIIAEPSDPSAKKFIAICTYCKRGNTVWMKPSKRRSPPINPRKVIDGRVEIPLSPGTIDIPMKYFISARSLKSRINYTKSGKANERQSKKK